MAPPVEFWDPQLMLELYLHDYMVKRKLYDTAEIFKKEAKIPDRQVVIDSPEGFLYEWWSVLHDVCASRQPKHQEEKEEASVTKTMQLKENEQGDKHPMVPYLAMLNQQIRTGRDSNFGKLMEQEAANELATKNYDEGYIRQSASEFDSRLHSLDVNKLNLSKSAATSSSNPLQGMYKMVDQQYMEDNRTVINSEKAVPTDPYYGLQNSIFPITGSHDSGMYRGVNPVPLNGWPLNAQNNQQFLQNSTEHQQPLLSQVLSSAPGKQTYVPGSSANFSRSNVMPPKSECRGKGRQMMENSKQTAEHQLQHEKLQQQKLLKNGRKRKAASHTGANPLDCTKAKEAVPAVENVESFLCHNDDNAKDTNTPFSDLKCPLTARSQNEHKGKNSIQREDRNKRKPVALELYIHSVLQTIEDHQNENDMKFLFQLPCCSCFCFIKGKKREDKEKEKEKDPEAE